VRLIPIEENRTERATVEPDREPYESERTESALVQRFEEHLVAQGHDVKRDQITPSGERPLYADLHDLTDDLLVEAKGTVTREAVRMAIGQLHDYQRFVSVSSSAILLPSEPRPDLLALVHSAGLTAIWEDASDFCRSTPSR
jgi:hypothetical protein